MFVKRSHSNAESFSKYRAGKSSSRSTKRSFRDPSVSTSRRSEAARHADSSPVAESLNSAIVTICVGPDQRLFAAHEDVLCVSPFFSACCRGQFLESHTKRINLPGEQPEILSSVLEYLYKGDYYPRLMHNKRRDTWLLEDTDATNPRSSPESTIINQADGTLILKDTAIYCAAERYGLDELKRLSLRKQGLQTAIQCSTILSSARYAYANTPDNDSKLRAHYLALIIRSRSTFKRSGTMQLEMEEGGKLFFDLFVAMCNHMDDLSSASKSPFSR
ncbi:hypothetical protein McanMca71_007828 [Microsporum canis]|uniref:BTB domain-containing protein n=1 Tax=Arthroderma otae (strain ATCC MYA-4605 / CBS 113480) TaxID=554155 RepID=C5FFS2_ARTOC|nr:conserved hypothetical protein [Microsporum canis CBS 113480]EEQ29607.1 conserved hypothetical protein [Microsporum canis CBS 113480]